MLCAGQRLDAASAGATGPEALAALREKIRGQLVHHGVSIGYASASAGADIIFGEEVLARSGELHIFLPCPTDDFAEQYVAPAGEEWIARFRHLVTSATESRSVATKG